MRKQVTSKSALSLLCAGILASLAPQALAESKEATSTKTARSEAQEACNAETMICKISPKMVTGILEKYGLEYEQRRNPNGDPLLIVKPGALVHDQGMAAILYGCDEENQCDTLSMYTFFTTSKPLEADVYHIWNDIFRVRTWSKTFRDKDGDTGFVMNVSAIGGTSEASLDFLTGVFLTEMGVFRDALEGVRNGSMTTAQLKSPGGWDALGANAFEAMAVMDSAAKPLELTDNIAPKALMGEK